MSKFSDRLAALGYADYAAYLASDYWKGFKAAYRAGGHPMRCAVCGVGRVQLHHHTYARLGAELPTDLTPLCRLHHTGVHEWLTANARGSVARTAEAVAALGGVAAPTRPGFVRGVPLGIIIRDKKRAAKAATKREKKKRSRANRPAAKARVEAFLALEPELTSLYRAGFVTDNKYYRARKSQDADLAQKLVRVGRKKRDSPLPPPATQPTPKKFTSRPRVSEPFQLNDKAAPNRDAADQKTRLRDILAARKKGGN